jgi:hypothetical protein
VVVIDNTNSTLAEYAEYIDAALAHQYKVHVLEAVCTCNHDLEQMHARGAHNVPLDVVQRMKSRWQHDPAAIQIDTLPTRSSTAPTLVQSSSNSSGRSRNSTLSVAAATPHAALLLQPPITPWLGEVPNTFVERLYIFDFDKTLVRCSFGFDNRLCVERGSDIPGLTLA